MAGMVVASTGKRHFNMRSRGCKKGEGVLIRWKKLNQNFEIKFHITHKVGLPKPKLRL